MKERNRYLGLQSRGGEGESRPEEVRVSAAGAAGAGGGDSDGEECVERTAFTRGYAKDVWGWKLCVSENLKDQCGWHTEDKGEEGQGLEV